MLGIDTATAEVAVAATDGESVLAELSIAAAEGGRPRHTAALFEAVAEAVGAAGGWERIEAIAVGVGPGTFTGLRVGIASARALAQGRGLPMVAVSSLAALARAIAVADDQLRLAAIDARRGEVFATLEAISGEVVWEPFVAGPDELGDRIAALGKTVVAAGDGSLRFRRQLMAVGAEVPPDADPVHRMAARQICALAVGAPRVGPEQVRPTYLRKPDAEVWRDQQGLGTGSGGGGA